MTLTYPDLLPTGPTDGNQPRREAVGVGIRIREYRKALGLSQRELADQCGLDGSAVSRIESGSRCPEPETLAALSTALGLTGRQTAYLFFDALIPAHLHTYLEH